MELGNSKHASAGGGQGREDRLKENQSRCFSPVLLLLLLFGRKVIFSIINTESTQKVCEAQLPKASLQSKETGTVFCVTGPESRAIGRLPVYIST